MLLRTYTPALIIASCCLAQSIAAQPARDCFGLELMAKKHNQDQYSQSLKDTARKDWASGADLDQINTRMTEGPSWLSEDGLTLCYSSEEEPTGYLDLYITQRPDRFTPFARAQKALDGINSDLIETHATLSQDLLEIIFVRSEGSWNSNDLYYAKRNTVNEPFGEPELLVGSPEADAYPFLSSDGLTLYYTHTDESDDIYYMTRENRDSPFSAGIPFDAINTENDELSFTLHKNGLDGIVAWRGRTDWYNADIYRVSRPDTNSPFGEKIRIDEICSSGFESAAIMTDDFEQIVCFRNTITGSLLSYHRQFNDLAEFDFETDGEGWQFTAPEPFTDKTTGNKIDSALAIKTDDNTNTFACWQSPTFVLVEEGKAAAAFNQVPLLNPAETGDVLIRSTFLMSNDINDPAQSPTLRLRASSSDYSQSDMLVVTSIGDGSYSPSSELRAYTQYFTPAPTTGSFTMNFDLLNFLTDNANVSTTGLDYLSVEVLTPNDLGTPETEASLSFTNNENHGWEYLAAQPLMSPAVYSVGEEGLSLSGADKNEDDVIYGSFDSRNGENITLTGGTMYAVTFQVKSNADQPADVPTFRLRAMSSGHQFATLMNIDSMNEHSRVPLASQPQDYTLYFTAPQEIDGEQLILAIDYLSIPDQSTDRTAMITLQNITITSYTQD